VIRREQNDASNTNNSVNTRGGAHEPPHNQALSEALGGESP
jgi:hypothetical protein